MGEPLFYVAEGEDQYGGMAAVMRRDETDPDNAVMVCVVGQIEGVAEEIARSLNRLPEAEALLIHTAQSIRAGADPQPLADALEEWAVG